MLSIRKIDVFVRVAESGQVVRASEELGLTQSAVSMALASLESLHGGPLFHRQGKKLLLNEQGRMLLPYAREILQSLENFSCMVRDTHGEPSGELHVGASTTIGNYLLPLLLGKFSRHYPQAKVSLQIANTDQIALAVCDGTLDLGLIEGPCHQTQLLCQKWRDDELVVIAAPTHSWSSQSTVGVMQLQQGDWIVRETGSGTREVFEAALGMAVAQLPSTLELGHTEAIKRAVEAGLGVSCLSRLAVQSELELGRLVLIPTPLNLQRSLSIICHGARYQSSLLKACVAMLSSHN
ncbi:MAG: LysR substrate-binding domain-containing protein [Desulfuromonas sp.]|nr:LysR substrate-binding domain-containing protein [Desulfuromonas sp.]